MTTQIVYPRGEGQMGIERRLTRRLIYYWKSLKREKDIPAVVEFNPMKIPDIWPYCIRISINYDAEYPLFYYDFIGPKMEKFMSRSLVGSLVDIPKTTLPASKLLFRMHEALHTMEPILDEGEFISDDSQIIKYRSCMVPFGINSHKVTHLLLGISWREFESMI